MGFGGDLGGSSIGSGGGSIGSVPYRAAQGVWGRSLQQFVCVEPSEALRELAERLRHGTGRDFWGEFRRFWAIRSGFGLLGGIWGGLGWLGGIWGILGGFGAILGGD